MPFLWCKEEMNWGGGKKGTSTALRPPDATILPRKASFYSRKCRTEEKCRHKEQPGLSAGHALCHHHSEAEGQSHHLPGHLVSPLPAALTWQRVDCGPPAGTGSSLQWSFRHKEIHTWTKQCRALKTTGQIQCCKKHLFNRRFKALPSQDFSWIFA